MRNNFRSTSNFSDHPPVIQEFDFVLRPAESIRVVLYCSGLKLYIKSLGNGQYRRRCLNPCYRIRIQSFLAISDRTYMFAEPEIVLNS